MQQELNHVEDWIDKNQSEFSSFVAAKCTEGRRKSSIILSEECEECINKILSDYHDNGFKKKRIQEGMEFSDARKPFEGCRFKTLREKHNTFMNFILSIHSKQKEKRNIKENEALKAAEEEENRKLAELKKMEEESLEYQRREVERLEAERRHALWRKSSPSEDNSSGALYGNRDMAGNAFNVSSERQNGCSEGRFIGAVYVGEDNENWSERFLKDKSSSWRVRL